MTDANISLTPQFAAMTPLQKWETLALNGLLGTNELWMDDMRQALQSQQAMLKQCVEALEKRKRELEGDRRNFDHLSQREQGELDVLRRVLATLKAPLDEGSEA